MVRAEESPDDVLEVYSKSAISRITIPEIICEIFDLAAAESFNEILCSITSGRLNSMPMTLSHVCRIWRNIALSTPAVWSRVHLQIGIPPNSRFPKRQAIITRSCLWNSKDHELTVHIIGQGHDNSNEELSLLKYFFKSSPRWVALYRRITFKEDSERFVSRYSLLWDKLRGKLNCLKFLELKSSTAHTWAFRDLPSLKSFDGPEVLVGVNYPNLEVLTTQDVVFFFQDLPNFPLLRTASLTGTGWNPGGPHEYRLVHNNLFRLRLPRNMMLKSKIHFDLPALKSLSYDLSTEVFTGVDKLAGLEQGLAHVEALTSQCQLRSLSISLAVCGERTVISPTFYQLMKCGLSCLTHLHVVECVDAGSQPSDLHLRHLLPSTDGMASGLLPSLVRFVYHLHDNGATFPIYDMVLQCVTCRYHNVKAGGNKARLEHFSFRSSGTRRQISNKFLDDLGSLMDDGLDVSASRLRRDNVSWDPVRIRAS